MDLSSSQTNCTLVESHPRIHLSSQLPNDIELIQAMREWCEQQFGPGIERPLGCSQYQWSITKTLLNTIFFEFKTQQQLDWFTLKWL